MIFNRLFSAQYIVICPSRKNRVIPSGEIVAIPERGMMMGNRGVIHDGDGRIVRPWMVKRWLICVLEFRGRHRTVMTPEASRVPTLILLLFANGLPACNASGPQARDDARKTTVAVVQSKSATIKQRYKCRIESYRHVEVRTEADGNLAAIFVREGQAVRRGDLLFQIGPAMGKEKLKAETPAKAVTIKAPCDGLVGSLPYQRGSFVPKYETLTIVSDSSKMSVYFDVPEKHYLEYVAPLLNRGDDWRNVDLELILADHSKYPHAGKIVNVLASFHNATGDISFLAEFPNPDGLLRHGETGTLLINWVLKDIGIGM